MPALVGSWYFPEPHTTVLPPHFVVSFSQQFVQTAALAVALVHFKLVRLALSFHPAMHEPVALTTATDSTLSKARGGIGRCDVTPTPNENKKMLHGTPTGDKSRAFGH